MNTAPTSDPQVDQTGLHAADRAAIKDARCPRCAQPATLTGTTSVSIWLHCAACTHVWRVAR